MSYSTKLKLLILVVIYVPNQLHFPSDLGIPGVNVLNLLFLLAFISVKRNSEPLIGKNPIKVSGHLRKYYFVLMFSFLISQFTPYGFLYDLIYLKTVIFYTLFYFVFFNGLSSEEEREVIFNTLLVVALVASLEAVKEGMSYGLGAYKETHRASGPFGANYRTSNRAGAFFVMFFPLFVSTALYTDKKWLKLAAMISIGVVMFAIFVTYSRQALLISGISLFYLFLKRNVFAFIIILIVLSSAPLWLPDTVLDRVNETEQVDDFGVEKLDVSTESRFVLWKGAAGIIGDYPWGIGLNRFKGMIGNYSPIANMDAHNYYVLFTTEAGIQGVIVLLILMFGLFRMGKKLMAVAETPFDKILAYGYTSSVMSLMLSNIYGSPFSSGEVMGNFWALSGLVARQLYDKLQEEPLKK